MFRASEYCPLRVYLAPPLTRDVGQQESLTFSPFLWPSNWFNGSHAIVFFRVPLLRIIARTGSKANMPEVIAALMGMERLEEGWVGGVQIWGHYMWDEYHVSSKESIFKLRPKSIVIKSHLLCCTKWIFWEHGVTVAGGYGCTFSHVLWEWTPKKTKKNWVTSGPDLVLWTIFSMCVCCLPI